MSVTLSAPAAPANRKRSPYFNEVSASPRNVYLFTGPKAWSRAKRRREQFGQGTALLLPPGEDPAGLRWPAVAGGVLIDARELDRQDALNVAASLVRDGTPLAFVIGKDFGFPVASPRWRNPLTPTSGGNA